MTQLQIDRNIWLRGEGFQVSRLLRSSDKKRCCLGIALGSEGIPDVLLQDVGSPVALARNCGLTMPQPYQWLMDWHDDSSARHSTDATTAMETNDDRNLSAQVREDRLTEIFARNGIEVTFIN